MRTTSRYIKLINNFPLLLLLIVPFVVLLPTIGSINYPAGGNYSDLAITHLPNAEFLKRTFLTDHQIPLWNPMIMSGYPFAGDPLSGLWYPPGWLALLFPLPLGINLITGLHIAGGAIGMFLLLRELDTRKEIALLFGVCFALLPKIFAHYGAGHITYIYAVCLTPLLMYAEVTRKGSKSLFNLKTILLSALILLADIRWLPFALIAWICAVFLARDDSPSGSVGKDQSRAGLFQVTGKRIFGIVAECVIGLLIAAPFVFPFIEFLLHSTRVSMADGENLIYSLPPGRLLGLITPPEGGFAEWIIYPGLVINFLIIVSLISKKWKIILPTGIFIFSLLWSLGNNVPLMGFLETLPGINMVRVPPRIVFLGNIMAIIAGAMTADWISKQSEEKVIKKINLALIGTFVFIILIGIVIGRFQDHISNSFLRLLVLCPLSFTGLIFLTRNKQKVLPICMLGVVVILDLFLTDITLFAPASNLDETNSKAVEIIKNDKTLFRVYAPTYSISQEVAGKEEIRLAEGVNPMQLADYVRYMDKASGIPYTVYSVVVPPLTETVSDNEVRNIGSGKPDSKLLGQLNVRYLLLDTQLQETNGWRLISDLQSEWLYINQNELPWAYYLDKVGDPQNASIKVEKHTPNELFISTTNRGGNFVISELIYPGWRAWVDGEETTIKSYQGIFKMLELTPGAHKIVFKYQPASLLFGFLISGIMLLLLAGSVIKNHANR